MSLVSGKTSELLAFMPSSQFIFLLDDICSHFIFYLLCRPSSKEQTFTPKAFRDCEDRYEIKQI